MLFNQENDFIKETLLVVVLYNTNLLESQTISSCARSIRSMSLKERLTVLLYDNSSTLLPSEQFELVYDVLDLRYVHDPTNPGVSTAYNRASQLAKKLDKKYLMLFDQDTEVPEDFIKKYSQSIRKFPHLDLFCPQLKSGEIVYSPCGYYFLRGFLWRNVKPGEFALKNKSVLNSGILVTVSSFETVGGFNEKVKLYFSDFEFVNRFRNKFSSFCVMDITLNHEISDHTYKEFDRAIGRFKHYVEGGRASVTSFASWIIMFINLGLKAVKLALMYRKINFVTTFIQVYCIR